MATSKASGIDSSCYVSWNFQKNITRALIFNLWTTLTSTHTTIERTLSVEWVCIGSGHTWAGQQTTLQYFPKQLQHQNMGEAWVEGVGGWGRGRYIWHEEKAEFMKRGSDLTFTFRWLNRELKQHKETRLVYVYTRIYTVYLYRKITFLPSALSGRNKLWGT